MQVKLIILNGPSGVGKSTIAARLHQEMPSSVLIDIDALRREVMPNFREHREESLKLAYEHAGSTIGEYLKGGHDVIVDKAILDTHVVASFVAVGRKNGAEIHEFILFANKETVQKRADDRGYKPGGLLTHERVGELWEQANALRLQRPQAVVIDTSHLTLDEVFEDVRRNVFST